MPNIFDDAWWLPRQGVRTARRERRSTETSEERRTRRSDRWSKRSGVKRRRGRRAAKVSKIRGTGSGESLPGEQWTPPVVMNKGGLVSHKNIHDMENGG